MGILILIFVLEKQIRGDMNNSKNMLNVSREANLSFEEIDDLAEEIRVTITGGKAYTVREYLSIVRSMDAERFGFRKGRAILFEPKLESYFPDSIFAEIKSKGRESRGHEFNEDDKIFIRNNIKRGIGWLADRFYTSPKEMYNIVKDIGLSKELTDKDFVCVRGNKR